VIFNYSNKLHSYRTLKLILILRDDYVATQNVLAKIQGQLPRIGNLHTVMMHGTDCDKTCKHIRTLRETTSFDAWFVYRDRNE